MIGFIVSFLVGIVCVIIGITNMKGNISSLHSYHRNRVSEEDKIPFGKKIGLGTIIIGCAVIVFSILSGLSVYTGKDVLAAVGNVVLYAGLIAGIAISFYAMIKYNKGIF